MLAAVCFAAAAAYPQGDYAGEESYAAPTYGKTAGYVAPVAHYPKGQVKIQVIGHHISHSSIYFTPFLASIRDGGIVCAVQVYRGPSKGYAKDYGKDAKGYGYDDYSFAPWGYYFTQPEDLKGYGY